MNLLPRIVSLTVVLLSAAVLPRAEATSLINLNFVGSMSASQQQVFNDAADFWNSAITGYSNNYRGGVLAGHSLTIDAQVSNIDGPYGILGQAGPRDLDYYRETSSGGSPYIWYASTGTMSFDLADVSMMEADNTFFGVILHEMAHVLGIGTLWTTNGVYTNGTGQYTASHALDAWRLEFNQPDAAFVPVELGGGGGTANGHWNEVDNGAGDTGFVSNQTGLDFRYELMTGWASNTFYVSTVTLGALEDLGYIVDYSKAGIITYPIPEPSGVFMIVFSLPMFLLRRQRKQPGSSEL